MPEGYSLYALVLAARWVGAAADSEGVRGGERTADGIPTMDIAGDRV